MFCRLFTFYSATTTPQPPCLSHLNFNIFHRDPASFRAKPSESLPAFEKTRRDLSANPGAAAGATGSWTHARLPPRGTRPGGRTHHPPGRSAETPGGAMDREQFFFAQGVRFRGQKHLYIMRGKNMTDGAARGPRHKQQHTCKKNTIDDERRSQPRRPSP